jgi:outer membrane protein assembly factor BamB
MTASFRALALVVACVVLGTPTLAVTDDAELGPIAAAVEALAGMNVKSSDCPQFGVSHFRNNISAAGNIPTIWDLKTGRNIKWSAKLGSQTYSSPVVANGRVFIGTNNASAYLERYPAKVDLGVLLCFDEQNGNFLWQHSNEKPPTGRGHDWEQIGICSTPYVEGNRLWYVTNRNEVVCLDTEGFRDDENDGPYKGEPNEEIDEADVVWRLDLTTELGALPRNVACCSVTSIGDTLLVSTSHGVGRNFELVARPSFLAMNKQTGKVLWSDSSPGMNILHGQWSSPAGGVLGGVPQAIFAGGDGWLYGFDVRGENGAPNVLWKFDCNRKRSKFMHGRGTRLPVIATPVIYSGLVYAAVGADPVDGEGPGHLWCVDPTKRGDISRTLVFNEKRPDVLVPHKRLQALDPDQGDFERENANSGLVWHYEGENPKKFDTTMHRSLSSPAIREDLLFITDESGLVHCLDARTGKPWWTHDMLAYTWSTPLIAGRQVYFANRDGGILVFRVSKEKQLVSEVNMDAPISTTPIVANGALYIATMKTLHAIAGP